MLRLVAVGRGCVGERVATQAAPVSFGEQEAEATKRPQLIEATNEVMSSTLTLRNELFCQLVLWAARRLSEDASECMWASSKEHRLSSYGTPALLRWGFNLTARQFDVIQI